MSQKPPPTRAPASVAPAETPGLSSLLSLCVAVVAAAGLCLAREVLIPITVAVILSFRLAPLVSLLRRWRFPHVLAVVLAVLVAFGVIGSLGALIGTQVAGIAGEVPRYSSTIGRKIASVQSMTVSRLSGLTDRLDRQLGRTARQATEASTGSAADAPSSPPPTPCAAPCRPTRSRPARTA